MLVGVLIAQTDNEGGFCGVHWLGRLLDPDWNDVPRRLADLIRPVRVISVVFELETRGVNLCTVGDFEGGFEANAEITKGAALGLFGGLDAGDGPEIGVVGWSAIVNVVQALPV